MVIHLLSTTICYRAIIFESSDNSWKRKKKHISTSSVNFAYQEVLGIFRILIQNDVDSTVYVYINLNIHVEIECPLQLQHGCNNTNMNSI